MRLRRCCNEMSTRSGCAALPRDGARKALACGTTRARTQPHSNPEIPMLQVGLCDQLRRRAAPHRAAALNDVMPVGNACEILNVLVDHQNRLAARLQYCQAVRDFIAY